MKINLNHGEVAFIDDADEWVANPNEKWRIRYGRTGVKYAVRNKIIDGKRTVVFLHREILGLGKMNPYVDHIDGDGLNCRRENLRVVTQECNTRNVFKARKTNLHSPYLGVGWHKKSWRARIYHDGRLIQIGMFSCIEAANRARLKVERDLCGIQPRRLQAFIEAGLA